MKIEEIASYCGTMGCTVSFGDAETGFVHVDGNGVQGKLNNYRRFLAHNELSALTSPKRALQETKIFRITRDEVTKELSRAEFQEILERFREAIQT